MVDIVTAVLIGFCFAVVVGALTFTSYNKAKENRLIRIAEIEHGIKKESKHTDVSDGYSPMWVNTRHVATTPNTDSITRMQTTTNGVERMVNCTSDLDPTTAFPKVESGKSYKAEPNEQIV